MTDGKFLMLLAAGAALAATTQVFAANVTLNDLQGAWALEGSECNNTFSKSGGKISFKNPGSEITGGVIVTGKKIVAPDLTCTAQHVKQEKDRMSVRMTCADALLIQTMSMSFRMVGKDSFERFDPNYPSMAFTYRRCPM